MTKKEQIEEIRRLIYHVNGIATAGDIAEALYNAGYRKNIEMKEYKFNFGDEVIITYGKLNGIHSTITYRENGDNYLEPLYKVSLAEMLIPQSGLKLYKAKQNSFEMRHSFELLATEIYKSENKEIISAFEQFCKETDVKLTKEIYLNNKSIIKKEIK